MLVAAALEGVARSVQWLNGKHYLPTGPCCQHYFRKDVQHGGRRVRRVCLSRGGLQLACELRSPRKRCLPITVQESGVSSKRQGFAECSDIFSLQGDTAYLGDQLHNVIDSAEIGRSGHQWHEGHGEVLEMNFLGPVKRSVAGHQMRVTIQLAEIETNLIANRAQAAGIGRAWRIASCRYRSPTW